MSAPTPDKTTKAINVRICQTCAGNVGSNAARITATLASLALHRKPEDDDPRNALSCSGCRRTAGSISSLPPVLFAAAVASLSSFTRILVGWKLPSSTSASAVIVLCYHRHLQPQRWQSHHLLLVVVQKQTLPLNVVSIFCPRCRVSNIADSFNRFVATTTRYSLRFFVLLVDSVRFEQLNHFVAFVLLVQQFELLKLGREDEEEEEEEEEPEDFLAYVIVAYVVVVVVIRDFAALIARLLLERFFVVVTLVVVISSKRTRIS